MNRGQGNTIISELTREQIKEIREVFDAFDQQGTGIVGPAEMSRVLLALGERSDGSMASRMLNLVDPQRNGTMNFEEFLAIVGTKIYGESGNINTELRKAFDVFDKKREGRINPETFRKFANNLGFNLSRHQMYDIMAYADLDNDGYLSFKEFRHLMAGDEFIRRSGPSDFFNYDAYYDRRGYRPSSSALSRY